MNVYENKYLIVCEKFIIQFFKNITKITGLLQIPHDVVVSTFVGSGPAVTLLAKVTLV